VIIGSPMHLHVAQSIAALERGVHVLCEVTAGVTIEECRDLVFAAERSDALFMMAENINYDRTSVLINSIVDAGKMGDVRTHFVELILPTNLLCPVFWAHYSWHAEEPTVCAAGILRGGGVSSRCEGSCCRHALAATLAVGHPWSHIL
jgi:predicted dehydrogenase